MSEIRLSKSCIGAEEKAAVMRVLDKGFLGMGQEVMAFEEELSDFFKRPTVCVVNGTAALQLALEAADIGFGDEVLVQSLTYVASFQAIRATGAIPVACDVNLSTVGIDLDDAANKITSKTKAIMPVHYAGGVGNLEAIYDFSKIYGLRVIEDAAHAFGTMYKGSKVGNLGDIVCFSLDGIKNITSGEGGCIVTNDQLILERVKDSRLLGVKRDSEKRFSGIRSWDPDVERQGWRYHMSDIMAAIGRVQLANFDYHKSQRQTLAKYYVKKLKEVDSISIFVHDYNDVVPHIFVIQLDIKIDRMRLIKFLSDKDIPVGIHYKPNHELSYFRNVNIESLKNTDLISGHLLTLPLHPEISEKNIDWIVSSLIEGIKNVA